MKSIRPSEELRLLSKVSKMYYEAGLTQDEIVERMQLSRSKVSRLLRQAREEGIVKITVISPPGIFSDLEVHLESLYKLKEVVVVESQQPDDQAVVSRELGIAAATYLQRVINEDEVLGVSWGSTLSCMVDAMRPEPLPGVHIVQIIGGIGRPESEVHATDLCRRMARLMDCRLTLLPAPGIVDNKQVKDVYLSDSHVQSALKLFSKLTMAVVGIGSPAPDSVLMKDGSVITWKEMDQLKQNGAIGDIALHFFDQYGQLVHSEIDQRVIGISLDQLNRVKRVIGVAGGPQKVDILRGALLGHLVNVLITDNLTAERLLDRNVRF